MPLVSPVVEMPRTSEVLWNGTTSLSFVLKRKRNGAILVTKIKEHHARATPAPDLRLGSELKLVGGFPVQQLTLAEVKKVMLHAPKPVSLVFLNHDDVILDNMSFLSEDRGSFENEYDVDSSSNEYIYPPLRESSEWIEPTTTETPLPSTMLSARDPAHRMMDDAMFDSGTGWSVASSSVQARGPSSPDTSASFTNSSCRRRRSPEHQQAPPRKVSKLKQALERMNELLNRPVRRSGLNVAAGKSIVV